MSIASLVPIMESVMAAVNAIAKNKVVCFIDELEVIVATNGKKQVN